jgi:hypothetical protein
MEQPKKTREDILAMTMEELRQTLPDWRVRSPFLRDDGLIILCGIANKRCEYLERGTLLKNEKEFATKRLLQKTTVGQVLYNWMNKVRYQKGHPHDIRNSQISSMREFMNALCALGFPDDVHDENSAYNRILDSFEEA